MIYAMSDIHGSYDEFIEMLEYIKFSKKDKLYIVGDAIDRGKNNLKILEYIMKNKNIIHIMGNHEITMLRWLEDGKPQNDYWWRQIGGQPVYEELLERDNLNLEKKIINHLRGLPYYQNILLNDRNFFLVHAGLLFDKNGNPDPEQTEEFLLWNQTEFRKTKRIREDIIVLVGHVPTKSREIFIEKQKIFLDCGLAYRDGKIGCIRLDDLQTFHLHKRV